MEDQATTERVPPTEVRMPSAGDPFFERGSDRAVAERLGTSRRALRARATSRATLGTSDARSPGKNLERVSRTKRFVSKCSMKVSMKIVIGGLT